MIGVTAPLWIGLFIGMIVGGLAEAWGISNPETLIRLGKWEDTLFIGCIAIAVGAGAIVLYGLAASGVSFHWTVRPDWTMAIVLGGILFGTGIAIGGYVPGSEWMALGEGRREAIYAIFGGLLGAATWTLMLQTSFGQWLVTYLNFGQIYFAGEVDTNLRIGFVVSIIWAAIMFTLAFTLPRYKKGKSYAYLSTHKGYKLSPEEEMKYLETANILMEGSSMPIGKDNLPEKANYHWAVSSRFFSITLLSVGIIIGLTVVLSMFLHQIFGEDSVYGWIVAYLWLSPSYWNYSAGVIHGIGWEPFNDIGTLLGGFLASVFFTRRFQAFNNVIPPSWKARFGNSQIKRAAGAFLGLYLTVLGGQIAGGCASGHILSGDIEMSVASLEFAIISIITLVLVSRIIYGRQNMSSEIEEKYGTTMEERRKKEPQMKKEGGLKAFIISMVAIAIISAALTTGTYNGYDPNPYSVSLTGFFVILAVVMTAVWYRTKYNNYSFEGNKGKEN